MPCIDEQAFSLLLSLPAFPFGRLVRPLKADLRIAKAAFLSDGSVPKLDFPRANTFNITAYRIALDQVRRDIALCEMPEAAHTLYTEKLTELATRADLIAAIQNKDDAMVSACSLRLYGEPTQRALELSDEFQNVLARASAQYRHREPVNAGLFADMVQRAVEHYKLQNWRIQLTSASSIRIGRSTGGQGSPIIHIPKSLTISRSRAARLLTHEIEVHALRTENGLHSPFRLLSRGLAGYVRTDEGLAVYYQQKLRTPEAIDAGFWDAWATALTVVHDMPGVFQALREAQLALGEAINDPDPEKRATDVAWRLCTRVYRGIHDPSKPGVGFMRDHVYRSGLAEVRRLVNEAGASVLPLLFAGHAGIQHLDALRELSIAEGRTPDMVGKRIVNEVMREHRKKKTM